MGESFKPAQSTLEKGLLGLQLDDVTDDTLAVVTAFDVESTNAKPVVLPIYHTSTYRVDTLKEYLDSVKTNGYIYSRLGNPSVNQVECAVKALEGAAGSLAFSSGMAATVTSVLALCKSGDHVICSNPTYSGTHAFLTHLCPAFGIQYTLLPPGSSVEDYERHIKENTKLLISETPSNPRISVQDLHALGDLGRTRDDLYTLVDTTYSTPYLVKPIKYGIDIVVHSATKYLGGHSDVLAGVASTRTVELWSKLHLMRTIFGSCLSPFDATLLSRGIKTLAVRMERHCDNAEKVADYLESHSQVSRVHYPGLSSHNDHEIASSQMRRYGGMIAFEVKGGLQGATTVVESMKLIPLAVSLGGVESLIEHPATMTHGPMIMTDDERANAGITDGLIRLSVGLEDPRDIIRDLKQALEKASSEMDTKNETQADYIA